MCLGLLGLQVLACDLKVGSEETKAPAGRRSRGKKGGGKSGGLADDPAVVQAVAELERVDALHVRVIGADESAEDGRTPAAMREAVLRRGGGRIAPERVHVASGDAGEAGVRFEFFVPEASPPIAGPPAEATQ